MNENKNNDMELEIFRIFSILHAVVTILMFFVLFFPINNVFMKTYITKILLILMIILSMFINFYKNSILTNNITINYGHSLNISSPVDKHKEKFNYLMSCMPSILLTLQGFLAIELLFYSGADIYYTFSGYRCMIAVNYILSAFDVYLYDTETYNPYFKIYFYVAFNVLLIFFDVFAHSLILRNILILGAVVFGIYDYCKITDITLENVKKDYNTTESKKNIYFDKKAYAYILLPLVAILTFLNAFGLIEACFHCVKYVFVEQFNS